jgi:hypothetical protein
MRVVVLSYPIVDNGTHPQGKSLMAWTATECREQAQSYRQRADETPYPTVARVFRHIAASWDDLAEVSKQWGQIEVHGLPEPVAAKERSSDRSAPEGAGSD